MASYLPDITTMIQAGFDPKTGLPYKYNTPSSLQNDIFRQLTILDEQNAIRRYVWYNLPNGLDGELVERILYYRGQGMFFYNSIDDKFYFLPFALASSIDVYGRFNDVTPLPFNGTATTADEKPWIAGFTKKVIKEFPEEPDMKMFNDGCVILTDYCKAISQLVTPRSAIQQPILRAMSEAIPLARTNLIGNCGVTGMKVTDESDASNVVAANDTIVNAALTGKKWIPIVGQTDFQDLSGDSAANADTYLMYMQSLDNYRLSLYGLKNGGVFEKDGQYVNNTQAGNIQSNVGLVYQDGLTIRQNFCDYVNSVWGINIMCDSSETVTNTDDNLNGKVEDDQDQSGTMPGQQPEGVEEE